MAFAKETTVTTSSSKADAFINVWVKRADGTRAKLGALPLKNSASYQAGVIARLKEGGDEAIKALMSVLEVDFKEANTEPVSADSVGF